MLKENFEDDNQVSNYETERHKPMPSFNHGAIQANIGFELKLHYNKVYRPVSEIRLELSNWTSVPDIAIFKWQKMDYWNDQIKVKKAPLGVVEILSPTQSFNELMAKAKSYFEHGVKSCWMVIPIANDVYVFSAPNKHETFKIGETLHDKTLDIKLEVNKIFE